MLSRIKGGRVALLALMVLVWMPITTGWVGEYLKLIVFAWNPDETAKLIWSAIATALGFAVTFHVGRQMIPARIRQVDFTPKKVVVMMISNPQGIRKTADGEWECGERKTVVNASWDLNRYASAEKLGNWQQLVRGLRVHAETLEEIYLIGSKETGKDATEAIEFLSMWFPKKKFRTAESIGITLPDFKNPRDLMDALGKILEVIKRSRHNMKDVVLDLTGGLKTASIAGAFFTLDCDNLQFQYVDNDGEVITADAFTEKYSG